MTASASSDDPNDPLHVLASTRPVVAAARHVTIDLGQIEAVAGEIAADLSAPPGWIDDLHFRDGTWRTAGWVLALDALNFCFWSADPDPAQRWRVAYGGEIYDGYWALVAALRRAVEEGKPLWDPHYLIGLTQRDVAHILRPHDPAFPEIPLFPLRVHNLHELGRGLIREIGGRQPVVDLIEGAERSAARLAARVVGLLPSFNDVATYAGAPVVFHKRAQILVADLNGAFAGSGLGAFDDLHVLSAFADYKVPQVLRHLGAIRYDDELAATIDARIPIPTGSPAEVEIRAATVWACELLRSALARRGNDVRAFEVDWALWMAGQTLPTRSQPYHRTYTVFY
ncbi:MAG: queuosine 5'-phosphate N-glycosylase/hydrolase [Thermomicrobiales bacterium]